MVWEHSRFGSHVAEVVQDRCLTPPVHRMEEHRAEANLQMPLSGGGGRPLVTAPRSLGGPRLDGSFPSLLCYLGYSYPASGTQPSREHPKSWNVLEYTVGA
jgi:hypothetical protein